MKLALVCVLAATASANPITYSYRMCDVTAGKVGACYQEHTGVLAVLDSGAYRECEIKRGRLGACKRERFTGVAEVELAKLIETCSIVRGVIQPKTCKVFDGKTVVHHLD